MDKKTLKTLEFNKITEMLAELAVNEETKKAAKELGPKTTLAAVKTVLSDTDKAVVSICKYGAPPILKVLPVVYAIKRIDVGGSLSTVELLNIAAVLNVPSASKNMLITTMIFLRISLRI